MTEWKRMIKWEFKNMEPLRLDSSKIVSIKMLPFDATTDDSDIRIFKNNEHYITGFDLADNEISLACEGEWVFEEKEEEVKNRFSFLDLDD
jgi:hypothetical protein